METDNPRLIRIREQLAELKADLGEKGLYNCCIWNRKQGKLPGVDPDAIQVTTFGIYGYEKGGHHSEAGEREAEHGHHEEMKHHH